MRTGAEEFEEIFGSSIVVSYALLARRYLDLHGLEPEEAFAPIALTARRHAMLNENAAYRKPITLADYRASPWIAEPFRRLDCSPVVDGAGAFVIVSRRVARGLGLDAPPVSYLGAGSQATHKIVSLAPDIPELGMTEAGRRAFAEAGLAPEDVDLLTVHDGFTASISITVEALGFCNAGECGRFAAEGGARLRRRAPGEPAMAGFCPRAMSAACCMCGGGPPAARRCRCAPGEGRRDRGDFGQRQHLLDLRRDAAGQGAGMTIDRASPFWQSVDARAMALPLCGDCGRFHFYPRAVCPECWSDDLAWRPVGGKGTVWSYTIVRFAHGAHEGWKTRTPYVVALIAARGRGAHDEQRRRLPGRIGALRHGGRTRLPGNTRTDSSRSSSRRCRRRQSALQAA